jgi:hypothetical protein
MGIGDHVGEIGTCSECHQQKKIHLEWSNGTNKEGNAYSPYLKCEDCASLDLEADKNK